MTLSAACLCSAVLSFSVQSLSTERDLPVESPDARLQPIQRIVPYTDEDYGFKLAVPEHWSRVFAVEDDSEVNALEPGYAIGFESPRSGLHDHFADYLMIEVLPGSHSGAFDSDGSQQGVVMVDGRMAVTDVVYLDGYEVDGTSLDLVVYQAEIIELGFTLTVFAIGEKREAAVLVDAFELALKTLKVPDDPFSVS